MDSLILRFFNQHDKLLLTADDFKLIEEEIVKTYKTGLVCVAKTDKALVLVDHDDKQNILIRKSDEFDVDVGDHILFQTILQLKNPPKELFTIHRLVKYRSFDKLVKLKTKNINDLKPKLTQRLSKLKFFELGNSVVLNTYDEEKLEKLRNEKNRLIKEEIKALSWLFDQELQGFKKITRPNIPTITDVIQLNNIRVTLIKEDINRTETARVGGIFYTEREVQLEGNNYYVLITEPSNPRYNYCSPGREIFMRSSELWCSDELIGKITYNELELCYYHFTMNEFLLLTPRLLNEASTAFKLKLEAERREHALRDAVQKVKSQNEKDYDNNKIVTNNGIVFGKDFIKYGDTTIKYDGMKRVVQENNLLNYVDLSFGDIYFNIISSIFDIEIIKNYNLNEDKIKLNLSKTETIKVNDLTLNILKKGNLVYINEYRVNKEDLLEILKQAINLPKNEYEEYLKKCSKLSLHLQKIIESRYLTTTISFEKTSDNSFSENTMNSIEIAIPIKYENYLYVDINGWKKVNDRATLLSLEKNKTMWNRSSRGYEGKLQRAIRILFKCVPELKPSDLDNFLDKAIADAKIRQEKIEKEHKKKLNNSLSFLKKCAETTNAKKVELDDLTGYFVKGSSGTDYFVSSDLRVCTIKDNKPDTFLCIVDSNNYREEDWEINDGIGQRLLMLAHDKQLAEDIYENGDRIDKHWLKIRGK